MDKSEIDLLRRFIITNKTDKALEGLIKIVIDKDKKTYNQAILLYSDYNSINEKINLGLGNFSKDKNRINLAILEILTVIENSIPELKEPVGRPDSQEIIQKKLEELENKIELILAIVERMQESALGKFVRSNVFKLLKQQTQNRLISLSSLESESDDYNFLLGECYVALEQEFLDSIFNPLKGEIIEENSDLDKIELLSKLEGNQKLEFYEFVVGKRETLTSRQMANLLFDNLNKKYNTKTKKFNYIFYYMLRKYVIIDRWQLEKDLRSIVEEKIDKKLNKIYYSKADYERIKDLMLKILRNMQYKQT